MGVEKLTTRTTLATKMETECYENLFENDLLGRDALVSSDLFRECFGTIAPA